MKSTIYLLIATILILNYCQCLTSSDSNEREPINREMNVDYSYLDSPMHKKPSWAVGKRIIEFKRQHPLQGGKYMRFLMPYLDEQFDENKNVK